MVTWIKIKPVSMTTAEAARRHPGITELQFSKMCLKGKRLKRLYGNKIPPEQIAMALFGKKVGKYWMIPVEELNRVFLPHEGDR